MTRHTKGLLPAMMLCLFALPHAALAQPSYEVVETLADPGDITCLASSDGGLWVGTLGAGMYLLTGDRPPQRHDAARGLAGNRVHGCAMAGGALHVASEGGLQRWQQGDSGGDPGAGDWRMVAHGRFHRLASDGRDALAAAAENGRVLYGPATRLIEARVDGSISALSIAPDGTVVVGLLGGALLRVGHSSALPTAPDGMPVEALGHVHGALHVRTAAASVRLRDDAAFEAVEPHVLQPWRAVLAEPRMAGAELGLVRTGGHHRGLWYFATDTGLWRAAQRDGGLSPERVPLGGMPCGDRISALEVVAGTLWVGSFDRGLCARTADGWKRFSGPGHLPSDMINDLATDGRRLYVATVKGLTVVHPDGRFEQRTVEDCQDDIGRACPWHAAVTGVAADGATGDANPAMWIADAGAVHRIAAGRRGKRWKHYYRRAGIRSQRITRIAAHGDRVAIGTADAGVLLGDGKRFTPWTDAQGLADNWVTDLSYGPDGSLWVATCTRGLSVRRPDGRLEHIGRADGLADDYTLAVRHAADRTWVGTLRGLSMLHGGRIEGFTTADGLSGNEVHDVIAVGERIWVATDGGLSVLAKTPLPGELRR